MYAEVNAIHKALLAESKRIAKALYLKWSELKELKRTARKLYEKRRDELRAEAWKLLEEFRAKYDKEFNGLEERIKTRFRAESPRNLSLSINMALAISFC